MLSGSWRQYIIQTKLFHTMLNKMESQFWKLTQKIDQLTFDFAAVFIKSLWVNSFLCFGSGNIAWNDLIVFKEPFLSKLFLFFMSLILRYKSLYINSPHEPKIEFIFMFLDADVLLQNNKLPSVSLFHDSAVGAVSAFTPHKLLKIFFLDVVHVLQLHIQDGVGNGQV